MACFKKNLSILTLTAWLFLAFGCGERRAERAFAPTPLRYAELLRLTDIHSLRYHWVKGHAENEFNNRCDELAVAESQKYK